jgi:beta-mannosidase
MGTTRELIEGWSFTEIGGGQGTGDGEWLKVERVPTTVHVELLGAGRIPDPVSRGFPNKKLLRPC